MTTSRSLTSEFQSADESPGFLLWRVTNRWQSAQRRALKPFGLTHVQFVLLASLLWIQDEGPVTQRHLAEHAATDPMMTSQVLRSLEERGLVKRSAFPGDRRARSLRVSARGASLANRALGEVERCDREFFRRLGPRQQTLTLMLRHVLADPSPGETATN
ncbi:MAG: MarR family transcriptional regulator [Acidimicrobiales bacterium]